MLNKDLFEDPKDLKIARMQVRIDTLEKAIADFKKYDQERNNELREARVKIGQLESYIEEIDATGKSLSMLEKMKEMRRKLAIRDQRVYLSRVMEMTDEEVMEEFDKKTFSKSYNECRRMAKELKKRNNELAYRVSELESRLREAMVQKEE